MHSIVVSGYATMNVIQLQPMLEIQNCHEYVIQLQLQPSYIVNILTKNGLRCRYRLIIDVRLR